MRMKFVHLSLIISSLFALSACSSWKAFHSSQPKPVAAPQATPAPIPSPAPAPATPPVAAIPETPPAPPPVTPPAPGVVTPPPAVATPATPIVNEPASASAPLPGLRVTRTGVVVILEWTLPPATDDYRAIEIMRNSTESSKGRTRFRSVRAGVTHLEDVLSNAQETRWYWLKLTNADNTVINFGPVEAK